MSTSHILPANNFASAYRRYTLRRIGALLVLTLVLCFFFIVDIASGPST